MFAMRLPEHLENRLNQLSAKTGRTKSYYVKKALEAFLEDKEDYLLAISVLEKKNPSIPLEKMIKELGLEN